MKYALVQIKDTYDAMGIEGVATIQTPITWRVLDVKDTIEPLQVQIGLTQYPDHYIIIQLFNE